MKLFSPDSGNTYISEACPGTMTKASSRPLSAALWSYSGLDKTRMEWVFPLGWNKWKNKVLVFIIFRYCHHIQMINEMFMLVKAWWQNYCFYLWCPLSPPISKTKPTSLPQSINTGDDGDAEMTAERHVMFLFFCLSADIGTVMWLCVFQYWENEKWINFTEMCAHLWPIITLIDATDFFKLRWIVWFSAPLFTINYCGFL